MIQSTSCNFVCDLFEKYPARVSTCALLVTLLAVAIITVAGATPAVQHFLFSTIPGYVTLGGSSLLTIGLLAWIFSPLCTFESASSEEPILEEPTPVAIGEEGNHEDDWVPEEEASGQEEIRRRDVMVVVETPAQAYCPFTEISTRIYRTVDHSVLNAEQVGNYALEKKGKIYHVLTVQDIDKQRSVLVRESTREPKLYRLVMRNSQGYRESRVLFSAAQLASQIRFAAHPQPLRISGFTALLRPAGIIVFAHDKPDGKHYFVVNRAGALEEVRKKDLTHLAMTLS